MKYFFDTEFLEDGKTIDLISIGIVAEDGRKFYAINEEANWRHVVNHPWLRENVLPHLPVMVTPLLESNHRLDKQESPHWRLRKEIADEIIVFVGDDSAPEFWAYYADYDWIALCQLYGCMIDLPKGWPMYCRDIKQFCDELGNPQLPSQESGEHDALADAIWNQRAHSFLESQLTSLKQQLAERDAEIERLKKQEKRSAEIMSRYMIADDETVKEFFDALSKLPPMTDPGFDSLTPADSEANE